MPNIKGEMGEMEEDNKECIFSTRPMIHSGMEYQLAHLDKWNYNF